MFLPLNTRVPPPTGSTFNFARAYVAQLQTKQVIGRHRGWGASISEVLDGVNSIISSNKKDDYVSQQLKTPQFAQGSSSVACHAVPSHVVQFYTLS